MYILFHQIEVVVLETHILAEAGALPQRFERVESGDNKEKDLCNDIVVEVENVDKEQALLDTFRSYVCSFFILLY